MNKNCGNSAKLTMLILSNQEKFRFFHESVFVCRSLTIHVIVFL